VERGDSVGATMGVLNTGSKLVSNRHKECLDTTNDAEARGYRIQVGITRAGEQEAIWNGKHSYFEYR